LSTTGKLFEKVILKIVKRHTGEKGLLNAGQFGFHARHSMTLQCMKINEDKMPAIYFSHRIRQPEYLLTINGQYIPLVNNVKYLGVIFETKAFRAFIRTYSLFKSEHSSANNKLTLYKVLIRSLMTYASPAWEFAANTHLLLKLQRLQNKVLRTIANFLKRTPVREFHKTFKILYIYNYTVKLVQGGT
jgi:hypothetical protein